MRRDKCALGPLPGEAFEFAVAADGFVQPLLKPGANSTPTTVHTFWHDAGVGDATMLGVWAANWARHGWAPRVLGMAAAQRHDRFVPLCTAFAALPSFNPKSYEMNNLLRWLAVARVGGRWMADYDVSVFSRPPAKLPNEGYLTVHGGATPSVVSGKSSEFLRIAEMFAYTYDQSNNATRRRHFVVVARNGELIPHASDQSLLDVLQHRRAIKTTGWAPGEAPGLAVTRNACPAPQHASRCDPLLTHLHHDLTTRYGDRTKLRLRVAVGSHLFTPRARKTLVSRSPCEALPGVHLLLRDRVSRRQRRALPPECHGHRGSARHQPHGGGGPSPCAVRIRRTRFPRHFLHAETAAALAVPFDRRTITVSLAPAFRVHADVAFRPSYLLTIMTTSRVRLGTRD